MRIAVLLISFIAIYSMVWSEEVDLIVDIAPLFLDKTSAENREANSGVIAKLENAFRTHGTVLLKGHGITEDQREDYFEAVRQLLGLKLEDKLKVKVDPSKAIGRGYLPFGSESGMLAEYLEPKEGFSYGHPANVEPANKMSSPNIWPNTFDLSYRESLSSLFIQLTDVASTITNALVDHRNEQSISNPKKRTDIVSDKGSEISLLRIFHYFSKKSPQFLSSSTSIEKSIGSSPHTDWGLLTFIIPNHVTGLQYVYNNTWRDVPYVEGTIAMNVGDFFSLATKGEYHSPIHRVVMPEDENRISFVLFYYPNYDSKISFPTEEEANQYRQCSADEHEIACTSDEANALAFNTLLSKHKLQGKEVKFGDYIVEKWEGVTRTGY